MRNRKFLSILTGMLLPLSVLAQDSMALPFALEDYVNNLGDITYRIVMEALIIMGMVSLILLMARSSSNDSNGVARVVGHIAVAVICIGAAAVLYSLRV